MNIVNVNIILKTGATGVGGGANPIIPPEPPEPTPILEQFTWIAAQFDWGEGDIVAG